MKVYNILIVEDDLIIGDLLQKILQRESIMCIGRKEGRKVLDIIHEIDLVVMDVMLPGEDGYQITKKIKI